MMLPFICKKILALKHFFFIDAPLSSVAPDTTTTPVESSNNFQLWQNKAQVYLSHQIEKTKLYVGQFDSVFGVEANDTLHNPLPIEGLVAQIVPSVHRGVMIHHNFKKYDLNFDFIAANQESGGYDKKKPLEWGVNFFKKWERIHASLGYLYSRNNGSNNELVNFISSFFLNKIKIDLEYAWIRKALSNKDSVGGSIRLNMPVDEDLSYQVLVEQADEINGLARQRLFVLSGSRKLMSSVKLKVGVGLMQNWQNSFDDKSSDQAMFTSSLMYSF
ncbi:MAG: hypothetical protein MK008_03805 [Bdellovibrionales bacterium]|nr:hypothetical protein [Bdellovibrionales bacterium]